MTLKTRQQQLKVGRPRQARFVGYFSDLNQPNNYLVCPLSRIYWFPCFTAPVAGLSTVPIMAANGLLQSKMSELSYFNRQPAQPLMHQTTPKQNAKVQRGDLLISIAVGLGAYCVVTKEIAEHGIAYINQHLTCIRLNKNGSQPTVCCLFHGKSSWKEQFELKNQKRGKKLD